VCVCTVKYSSAVCFKLSSTGYNFHQTRKLW
jgi:hypothetical protein